MNIDEEMKELREAINIESHIALQLNTLLCKCNVCNEIGNLYIFLTIFKRGNNHQFAWIDDEKTNLKYIGLPLHKKKFIQLGIEGNFVSDQ